MSVFTAIKAMNSPTAGAAGFASPLSRCCALATLLTLTTAACGPNNTNTNDGALGIDSGWIDERPYRPDIIADRVAYDRVLPNGSDAVGTIMTEFDSAVQDVPTAVAFDVLSPRCAVFATLNPRGDSVEGMLSGPSSIADGCRSGGMGLSTLGPEQVFGLTLDQRRVVTLRTSHTAVDTVLSVRRDCANSATELACNHYAPLGDPGASSVRTILDPGTYQIVVDQFSASEMDVGGPFRLSFISAPVAANTTCANAAALTNGAMLTVHQASVVADSMPCGLARGKFHYFSARVAPGQRVLLRATPDRADTLSLFTLNGCADVTCDNLVTSRAAGTPLQQLIDNQEGAEITRVFALSATDDQTQIAVTAQIVATPNFGSCAGAAPLPDTVSRWDFFAGSGMTAGNGCGVSGAGSLFYSAIVPAGQSFELSAQPHDFETIGIRLLSACGGAATCLGADPGGGRAHVSWVNEDPIDRPVIVEIVNRNDRLGSVVLSGQIGPTPRNGDCGARVPAVLVPERPLVAQNALLAPVSTSCVGSARQLYYQVSVPPLTVATVEAQSPNQFEFVRIASARVCGAGACIGQQQGVVTPARLTLDNSASRSASLFQIAATGSAPFSIHVQFANGTEVYDVTRLPVACVDLDAVPVAPTVVTLVGTDGDDTLSAVFQTPFPLTIAGTRRTFAQVSSNGFVGLLAGLDDLLASSFPSNGFLPDASQPTAIAAPYWGDLVATRAVVGATQARTAIVGAMPNRTFVIEWRNRTLAGLDPSNTRARFQAHFRETGGVIEYHYCEMFAPAAQQNRIRGGAITIGADNLEGTRGIMISRNTNNAIDPTQAFRLTPRP